MKMTIKEVVITRVETLLLPVGLCCCGVFIYMQYNVAQATQKADEQYSNKTEHVHVVQKSVSPINTLKAESFERYFENYAPNKAAWSQARLEAFANLEKEYTQLDSIGLLNIPMLQIRAAIFNDTSNNALGLGVGRVKGTSYFGLKGNVALAGHRDGFFRNLKDISKGDEIVVRYQYGKDIYRVGSMQVVEPTDDSILQDTDESTMTLITSYPFDFVGVAPQRFIVKAINVDKTLNKDYLPNSIHYEYKENI